MNDWTEQAMKGWRPRPPSAGLRSRIFACEAEEERESAFARLPFNWAGLTRWLVPAAGCFLMVTGTLMEPQLRVPAGAMEPISGQHLAFATASRHNTVPATTLEWTFGRPSSSSNDSFIRTETNTLIK